MRKTKFANEEYYHIYNRGVDKRKVFQDEADFLRFYISLDLLNDKKDGLMEKWREYRRIYPKAQLSDFKKKYLVKRINLIEIVAFCMIYNHYHLLVKQKHDKGIEMFMHRLGTSYTKYFNQRNDRSGALFQGRFKSSHIDNNNLLLYLSVYVNCNIEIHQGIAARDYSWCSYAHYLGQVTCPVVRNKAIISQFRNYNEYRKFASENTKHLKEKKKEENILIESES